MRAGGTDADVARRDRGLGQRLGRAQRRRDLGLERLGVGLRRRDAVALGHDLDRALHPRVDVAVVRERAGLGELDRERLRLLRERKPGLDALGPGVGGLLAEEPWRAQGRGEAEQRLPYEPELSAGGIGHWARDAGR